MRRMLMVVAVATSLVAGVAAAQSQRPEVRVAASKTCDTHPVGARLIYEIRQEVAKSATLKLDDSSPLSLTILCLDDESSKDNSVTIGWVVQVHLGREIVAYPLMLEHGITKIGTDAVEQAAPLTVAHLDRAARKLWQEIERGEFEKIFAVGK